MGWGEEKKRKRKRKRCVASCGLNWGFTPRREESGSHGEVLGKLSPGVGERQRAPNSPWVSSPQEEEGPEDTALKAQKGSSLQKSHSTEWTCVGMGLSLPLPLLPRQLLPSLVPGPPVELDGRCIQLLCLLATSHFPTLQGRE